MPLALAVINSLYAMNRKRSQKKAVTACWVILVCLSVPRRRATSLVCTMSAKIHGSRKVRSSFTATRT